MRIAVNTRLLLSGKLDGIGWFTYETLKRMVASHPEHEFIFIFDRKPSPKFVFEKNVKAVVAHPQARHPILWYLFFEFGVYRILKKYKPDLFLSPDGWMCLRTNTPSLSVIHDLNFEKFPEFLPKLVSKYYRYYFPRFAKKAARIATVSEFSKVDIHNRYGVSLDDIDVVYNGANTRYNPLSEVEKAKVKEEYTGGADYFLFVGLIHPRKNLENQLKAFEEFKLKTNSKAKFVVVGDTYWASDSLKDFMSNSVTKGDVIFLGRQSVAVLSKLYGAATALCYVSHFEGFGIPILEAFHAEIPVITANTSSMPEICGDAGITVDPSDVSAISLAMNQIATNAELRESLIEKGRVQKMKFSWDKTAAALWVSIQKAYESAHPNRPFE